MFSCAVVRVGKSSANTRIATSTHVHPTMDASCYQKLEHEADVVGSIEELESSVP